MTAKALVTDPKILPLDEPTANLDSHFQMEILDLVLSLSQRPGLSVVMVLHDLTQAYRYSHKVLTLREGRVFALGKPEVYRIWTAILEDLKAVVLLLRALPDLFLGEIPEGGLTCPFKVFYPPPNPFLSVLLFEGFEDFLQGQIGVCPPEPEVFHELAAVEVEGLKDGVLVSVKFHRRYVVKLAKFPVEGRGGLDPPSFEEELRYPVEDKDVRPPQEFYKLFCGQVIPHVKKTEPGRYTEGSAQGTEKHGLGDTEGPLSLEYLTGFIVIGFVKRGVGIIPDPIPYGIKRFDGLLYRVPCPLGYFQGKGRNLRVIGIDCGGWQEVLFQFFLHGNSPRPGSFGPRKDSLYAYTTVNVM